MNILLSLALGLLFMVLQAGWLHPLLTPLGFDLLLPLLIYLIIFRPLWESFLLSAVFGLVQGGLSGAPLGLYAIVYLWLLMGVRGGMRLLDAGSYFVFPLFLALGMLTENVLFAVSASSPLPRNMVLITVSSLVAAPLFLLLFRTLFDRLRRMTGSLRRASQE